MKIVDKRSSRDKFGRLAWFLVAALLLVLVLFAGWPEIGRSLSTYWPGVRSLLQPASAASDLPALTIDMAFTEFGQILDQRTKALSSGVVVLGDQDLVPADMGFEGQTIPVEMRLQQGPVQHLGDDEKWNFEVRTRGDHTLAGMQRFYLIDPADNNWLNEKAFAAALRSEGLPAGRYEFVRLFLNGDYKGIYALQEGFGPELLAANGRAAGVIVEFDARRLWEGVDYFGGRYEEAVADPVTNLGPADFQFFEVDTFRDAAVAADPLLSEQKDRAIGLLRGLQSGELPATVVFDVEKYGRFLALVDLWAATEATHLTNLRYYYDPTTGLLEPIGFNANPFGSTDRLPMTATFEDPSLQSAYLRAAQRMAEPAYLAQLEAALAPELEVVHAEVAPESEQPLPWDSLDQRQADMRRSLSPLQPVFAYLGSPALAQEGLMQIDVANVLNLPLEIVGFDIGGATFMEADPAWVQGGEDNLTSGPQGSMILRAHKEDPAPTLGFVRFQIPFTAIQQRDSELDYLQDVEIQVATKFPGLEEVQLTAARPGYPAPVPAARAATPGS